ncbi:MAG: hypothetical protein IJY01_00990 [Clostridia bacterium]|nr:hypothetical protein [Clostridia bacterium]
MATKILVIGCSTMDLSMNLFKLPEAGCTVSDDGGVAYTPGGGGAGVAVALTRLGAECTFLTKLGADVHGQKLFKLYKEFGLDTSSIKVDHDFPTGFSVHIKEADGTARRVIYPGANSQITPESLAPAFDTNPDAVYIGLDVPFSTVVSAGKLAAARGIPLFLSASPASKAQPIENIPASEVVILNEKEIEEYTGTVPAGTDSWLRAAYQLYEKLKTKYVVLTLGSRGAFIYDGKRCNMITSYKPEALRDLTGAGEAFSAALTFEYMRCGGNILSAVAFGCAAASVCISRKGVLSSMPTAGEVADVINRNQH